MVLHIQYPTPSFNICLFYIAKQAEILFLLSYKKFTYMGRRSIIKERLLVIDNQEVVLLYKEGKYI